MNLHQANYRLGLIEVVSSTSSFSFCSSGDELDSGKSEVLEIFRFRGVGTSLNHGRNSIISGEAPGSPVPTPLFRFNPTLNFAILWRWRYFFRFFYIVFMYQKSNRVTSIYSIGVVGCNHPVPDFAKCSGRLEMYTDNPNPRRRIINLAQRQGKISPFKVLSISSIR